MRKLVGPVSVGSLLLVLLLGWSPSAQATAYTIASSTAFSSGGVTGTIDPVTSFAGTSICLAGTCAVDPTTQDWLIVSVTLTAGAVDQIDMSAAGATSVVGLGYFSDANKLPQGGTLPSSSIARFDYDNPNVSSLNLQAGETTDRLFGAFTLGTLPGPGVPPVIPAGTASFMLSIAGGTNFSVSAPIVVVPEPGTLLLVSSGLLALGLARRRTR